MYIGTGFSTSIFQLPTGNIQFDYLINLKHNPKYEISKIKTINGTIRTKRLGIYHNFATEVILFNSTEINKMKRLLNFQGDIIFYPKSGVNFKIACYVLSTNRVYTDQGDIIKLKIEAVNRVGYDIPDFDWQTTIRKNYA